MIQRLEVRGGGWMQQDDVGHYVDYDDHVAALESALAASVPVEVAERACDLMGGMFHKMSRHPETFGEWHVVGDPVPCTTSFAEQNPSVDASIGKWSAPALARALSEHEADRAASATHPGGGEAKGDGND